MNPTKQPYYYAVVNSDDSSLILESGRLPIYWLKSIAAKKSSQFEGTKVKRISSEEVKQILISD